MNNDFNSRLGVYERGSGDFQSRLSNYSLYPSRGRKYRDENWWDTFSSLMQAVHETSISSLNDDNRNDEKEIELLEEASKISDKELTDLQDIINFYNSQYEDAKKQSNNSLALHYRTLKDNATAELFRKKSTLDEANKLVKNDKSVLSSHNPILEAIGEIFDTTTTGASIGASAGALTSGIGSVPGGVLGAIAGLGYGVYDLFSSGRDKIDSGSYTKPESTNRLENYLDAIKTRQSYKDFRGNLILQEYDDLFWWKTEYPVSDYYRDIEQSNSGNYAYYNLPGIVGSSFSDTKDLGQQVTTAYGVNKLANKIPNSKLKFGARAVGFLSALRNGWQQSLNENHAEASDTSVKKAIAEISKNKLLEREMLQNAKDVAITQYGLDRDDADKLIDNEVAFTMYQGGIGGLNPRKLQNSYDYYKAARQLGDAGADTLFERDMIATAGGDVLEAALMVTPYGALAKRSKTIGKAVAGAAIGATAGEFLGFGVGGSVIGGGIGAIAAQNKYARKLWRSMMNKTLAIEDDILPKLESLIMFDKGLHAASAFGATALAEAAEEGTQYLNSLDAEKILTEADDKIDLRDMKNLFVNDLKKRGEVFNAVLSQIGLTDSPYQNDQEFWANWKGGLVLGGLMTGATVSLSEGVGAKKAYNAAKFLRNEVLNTAVANRVASQDAILKGAAFAKYGAKGNLEDILDIIDRAKNKNKNRTDTGYSDKDFDELSELANRIISKLNHKTTRQRLNQLGYEIGSEEANYAIAVNDYYQQKTRENAREERRELGEKIKLINDPNVIEALNIIAGEDQMQANDFEDINDNNFTYKVQNEDGTFTEETISNRDRLLRLHQNSAELISIAQLLKDLQDIQKIQDFARTQGVAFGRNQIESTISLLKDKYNLLKRDVESYANEQFDSTTTTYDLQIEHLKGYLLDLTSGLKLVDLYRNSVLRMLNQRVYTNILRALAIDTDVNASNEDVRQASKQMTKLFSDNVQKNKQLLEILDYNIENEFENADASEQEQQTGTRDTNAEIQNQGDVDLDDGSLDVEEEKEDSWFNKILNRINKFFKSDDQQIEDLGSDIEQLDEDLDDIGQRIENVAENLEDISDQLNGLTEDVNLLLQLVSELQDENEQHEVEVIPEDIQSVALPQDPEELKSEDIVGDDRNQQAEIISEDTESVAIPSELENALIVEDLEEDVTPNLVDRQQETINQLTTKTEDSPKRLINGWYITKDGKIIPSDKMYMANPVETPKTRGQQLAEKYRMAAAQIRFNIHRHILEKGEDGFIKLKQYVGLILGTSDSVVIDSITKAIKNGDQNAVKLLIMKNNPRPWQSYYTNEFFRRAAREILNGLSVQRPEYIDKEAFKNFCRQVLLYKASLEHNCGYKFITNIAPAVTKINGEDVVADPDFIAVDNAGNAHIINIYTINNESYKKRKLSAETYTMNLGNTANLFSQDQERNILADILMKGIRDGNNVIISSASLLPVVVDGYTAVNRLYLGKLIPLKPNDDSISKYVNQEDLLLELKELLVKANEKAKQTVDDLNNNIDKLRKYRQDSKKSGYTFNKKQFTPDKEPTSVAEAYAQLDKALLIILSSLKYYSDHMEKEISEMEKFYEQQSSENKKLEISKEIERINKIKDETRTVGILVKIVDGDSIINNQDLFTKGTLKAKLRTAPNGTQFVGYYILYDNKEYHVEIYVDRDRKYGKKNGDIFKQNSHPIYTKKLKRITNLLILNPDLVLTFDLRRSFIRYAEDAPIAKPRDIIGKDGLISDLDAENLGVLQNDGKIVSIGFYDKKTGVIQTGQNSQSATIAHAPEGEHWQNKLFLVIKQKHLEEKAPDRTVSILLIRKKFDKKLATFIATCYKIIAETNHQAGYDSQLKRMLANQLLHLFISLRLVYKKGEEELPNVVYINGETCRINGKDFFILNQQGFNDFVLELQKCEIMPSWDTLNVKFKNLAKSGFSKLYDHFSSNGGTLNVSIDGVDSGLEITKELFDNDSLCQWLVRNSFFASKYYVERLTVVSMHNVKLVSAILETVKEEQQQAQQIVAESEPEEQKPAEQPIVMSEEEFNNLELEEVDENEEDDDYDSPLIPINSDLNKIRNIKTSQDVINTIGTNYPRLVKLLNIAISKIGIPTIHVNVSEKDGETALINGVLRQKQGNVIQNEDGSWTITIFRSAKNPIKTLAHETVHIFTLGAIKRNSDCAKACRIFYQYCKDSFVNDEEKPYGFKSFKEFIAEFFTNNDFRLYLMSKNPMDESVFNAAIKNIPAEQKNKIKTLYDSVVSFISKIWQKYVLRQSPTLYTLIYDTMEKIFGDAYNERIEESSNEYTTKNHATGQKITLQNCKSRAQLRAAIDGIMTAWIRHENITALGKNIDKLNFSTRTIQHRLSEDIEFAQWWQRTFTYSDKPLVRELTKITRPTKDSLKTESNPDGFIQYEKKIKTQITIQKKDGSTETKWVRMPKTFTSVSLLNWDLITPVIDEFMADMRIETRKKIEDREFDEEMNQRDDGRNVFGELLTESYEIDPLDRASREVKWMFSTIPYGRVIKTKNQNTGEDILTWEETTDHNEFGMSTFIPFRDVYGKVLYYTSNCHTTQDILNKFYLMAHTGPDKAMFLYLYNSMSEMIANRWKPAHEKGNKSNPVKNSEGLFFDANVDSTVIKIIRALRQQQNNFVWAVANDEVDNDGNRYKNIDIKTTLYLKKAIETTKNWKDLLATGMSDVLKYDPETQTYKFRSGINGNLFQKIYRDLFIGKTSFIYAYNSIRKQDPEDVTLNWLYLKNPNGVKFSLITSDDVKMYLHNALLHCGIDISLEIIDHWLQQIMSDNPTIKTEMDALYTMLSDQHSKIRPSNFFARLANLSETGESIDDSITQDTINIAFGSGFVTELANLQNEYDLRTQGLMTVASHNNQYYIVSESNYVNDIKDIINKQDGGDKYINMLLNDSFASGSVVVEEMMSGNPVHLDVSTFVGMKTKNIGDQGRDYFEIELDEDIISKLELLHEGYMLCPTISDKKTYHVISGIPLVGMLNGVRSNTQCYYVNPKTGELTITDSQILDRFVAYFKSERDAVEKAVLAYESEFYKNNPGKKIANYSDKNALKFSSFCCLPLANGEKVYLNKDTSEDPRINLNTADNLFFKAPKSEQHRIILRILLERAKEDIDKIVEVGLIKRNEDGSYENIGLDGATILDMAERRIKAFFGANTTLYNNFKDENGNFKDPKTKAAMSSAVYEYCLDCTIKHLMSMQEYQRLFSGSKAFYKWKAKGDNVTDISVDYTKRRGGDISTGGVNIYDIDPLEGMEELGTYRCIEIEDYLVESSTLGLTALILQFETSDLVSAAAEILSKDNSSQLSTRYNPNRGLYEKLYKDRSLAEEIITSYYTEKFSEQYAKDIISVIKQKAKANAMQYFRNIGDEENPINVADGATYITDRMCERLLREEGKWDDDMKYAFEVLRGEHGADVLSKDGLKLYKSILHTIIGTQKYTATGFRESDDGNGGILMTPYYNKTALFPVFEQISYGTIGQILDAMRKNNVDVMMMTSAVKTGSQGAITIDQMLSGQSYTEHTYVQEIRFLRKQLNTDPSEREEMNLGTQTIKIALSNLRMDDDYIDPFTGKTVKGRELYSNIMRCYNILTDIGFEQVMMRFTKRRVDGLPTYLPGFVSESIETDENGQIISIGPIEKYSTIPDIDEKALSDFLHEELMSRDANDNMFDAIAYDKDNDRLSSPVSAISQSGWIDSILSAYISKSIIDTKSPGAAFIQRSVFSMEGDGLKTINDGKDLKLINEDGSMDAVISIDFFEKIIPGYEDMTFEEAREWLIKHKLVGKDAKTYTISYRIPTQAQSSINPLKFVDVVPIIKDSIILPKDFTRLTGSDFDIDKLFISRLFINPDTVEDENQMFTFLDNRNWSDKNELLDTLRKGFVNKLFLNYISLLMDKNSANTKWRPIDADTELWKSVHKDLYPSSSNNVESMLQDTLAYQTEQKNNFVVGKIGIGPYALNNNNHIYTMLYHIKVRSSLLLGVGKDNLDMSTLWRGSDIYGNSIMSWLSGGINAHVDIAKDPFVTKLNINKYTYNISNFLIRAGFGRNGLWFLNQPVIKELARRLNGITGQYLKNSTKSIYDAQKEVFDNYKKELAERIPAEELDKFIEQEYFVETVDIDGKITKIPTLDIITDALGRRLTIRDVLINKIETIKAIRNSKKLSDENKNNAQNALDGIYRRDFEKPYVDDLATQYKYKDNDDTEKLQSMIYNEAKFHKGLEGGPLHPAILRYMSIVVFDKINSNEAKITSDVVKYTKIDTKKHGTTIAALLDFRTSYERFIAGLQSTRPKVLGNVEDLFGIPEDTRDVLGFSSSINLNGTSNITDYTDLSDNTTRLISPSGQYITNLNIGTDITESSYVDYKGSEYGSFINNKTRKAINALTSILRNESVESTYGFEYIWRTVKNDFGKSSLTEDMQSKLRSTILGAIKSQWIFSKMKSLGIDPISLFKDGDNTVSLAHELYRMKTKSIRYLDENHVNRRGEVVPKTTITTVAKLFKDNALLKILHDAHSKDDYSKTDILTDVLDFIKIHIPFTDDKKNANVYINAWRDLYNNELTKDFAVKLMFYSFITSNDQGGSNLFKYVPFEMLEDYGLIDAERLVIKELNSSEYLYSDDIEQLLKLVQPIVDRVETILCEDFDFSSPYHLESIKKAQDPIKEYTGFISIFNKKIVKRGKIEKCDRIPYIFIPARINSYGGISMSKTIVDSYGGVVNRPYIRVYNPVRTYENEEKYFIYKRIGEIQISKKRTVPIYKLINSSMYTLGEYKIYNYSNEMDISSTQILKTIENYILSEKYSIKDITSSIEDALREIERNNSAMTSDVKIEPVDLFKPLSNVDEHFKEIHKQHVEEQRVFNVKTKMISKFNDGTFIEFYKNQHNTGKEQTKEDLIFAKNSNLFTEEEKFIINQMLTEIAKYNEILEQIKAGRKQNNKQVDPTLYHMYSGGAFGSDTAWSYYGQQYGIPNDPQHISHYYFGQKTPTGNVALTKEQFFEGLDKVFIADQTLHRFDNMSEKRQLKIAPLLARNWMLVKNSDAVFAIGELKYGKVDGGTGWAVLMAIDNGKPVHVFNLSTEQWFTWDTDKRTWVVELTPKLTKNFAGIGTRSIDKDIERKTANYKNPVKYVGDQKRQAAINAINDVYRNTFGDPKPQPKNPAEFNGKNNPQENFNGPKESQEVLESPNTILSNKELLKLKPYTGSDTHPRIAVASEHADPAFFAQLIVGLFDEGKPLTVKQMKTVKTGKKTADGKDIWERKEVEITYTAEDFDALYIITKHDGLPLKKILQTKIPKLIHFSVTGMGGTSWEPGVMKYQDMLKRIKDFMKMGLDPEMVTMRIDPIIPGVTPFEVIEDIVKKSAAMGIKTIKFSVMDWYRSTVPEVVKNTGYDYSKYYEPELDDKGEPKTYWWCPKDKDGKPIPGPDGKPQWEKHIVYKPDAKVEEQKKISDFMLSLKDKYGVTLQSCAEPLIQEGIEKVGCLSVPAINNMLGTHIEDRGVDNNKQRALCTCYGGKTDLMSYNTNCASVCWYCYAHHQGDKILNYYNPDGTLKDNAWTRTGYEDTEIIKTVQRNGKIRLSLPSHTDERPRLIVLEPAGDNKYYVHQRLWDDVENKIPASNVSNEDKKLLFDALYNELPDGAEILLPNPVEGKYVTRGAIAGLLRLARDNRFTPGTKGTVKYEDRGGSIKEYEGTSFIKKPNKTLQKVIKKYSGYWTRTEAKNNPRILYIFTDNIDRSSGSNPVPDESWYNKQYGPSEVMFYPNSTAAVVRGLDNARPISTMHFFYKYHNFTHPQYDKSSKALWHDSDLEEFKSVIRSELENITEAWNTGNFDAIMFPDGDGLFNTKLSQISKQRTPKLYKALSDLLTEFGFEQLIPVDPGVINVSSYDDQTKNLSNFAERKFETELAKGTPKMKFNSVEQAFQSSKAYFAWSKGDITDEQFWDFINYAKQHSGSDIKKAGGRIPMSLNTISEWNKVRNTVLEVMMLRSFLQDDNARQELLNTGNAEFTHNYQNGNPIEPKEPKRFGDILSKVRSKLREEQNRKQECK